jgi:transcription elongation GreA/GreB family factor
MTSVRTSRPVARAPRLTREGYAMIEARIADIHDRRLPELRPLLVEHDRDERDVATFEALLAESARWEALLAEAEVIPTAPSDGTVAVGTRVRVSLADGSASWVRPVHPAEAFLDDERISLTSPLGSALIGARPGDVLVVEAPVGPWECTVLAVEGGRRRRGRTTTGT